MHPLGACTCIRCPLLLSFFHSAHPVLVTGFSLFTRILHCTCISRRAQFHVRGCRWSQGAPVFRLKKALRPSGWLVTEM
jgi:hypothetical protein